MKKALQFVANAVLSSLIFLVSIYLAVLVLIKRMKSVGGLVRPLPCSSGLGSSRKRQDVAFARIPRPHNRSRKMAASPLAAILI